MVEIRRLRYVILILGLLLAGWIKLAAGATAQSWLPNDGGGRTPKNNLHLLPTPTPTPTLISVSSRLLVDSEGGRLYTTGRVKGLYQTVVLATTDGRLLATYPITGRLALDSAHAWLYVDQGSQGLAVLDSQTGAVQRVISLPTDQGTQTGWPLAEPQVDPATGRVYAFRDNQVYLADPTTGVFTLTLTSDINGYTGCSGRSEDIRPIQWAAYDSSHDLLYIGTETSGCISSVGSYSVYTISYYDMPAGIKLGQHESRQMYGAVAFDGSLYTTFSNWDVTGVHAEVMAVRPRQSGFRSTGWSEGGGSLIIDPGRRWLYNAFWGRLRVFDATSMALVMSLPSPIERKLNGDEPELAGYDPKTDQLYFVAEGQLRLWPASALTPSSEPLVTAIYPPTAVQSIVVSPQWPQDQTLFGLWSQASVSSCAALRLKGGAFYLSQDGGRTWSQSLGGLRGSCQRFTSLAISPNYTNDQTLFGGVIGQGVFKSTDGGQLWRPTSAGLLDMSVQEILLSPNFGNDQTAFVLVSPDPLFSHKDTPTLYRSRDGGVLWQPLTPQYHLVALSPEFDQDSSLMGVAKPSALYLSSDDGDSWEWVGDAPSQVRLLSLAPLFAKWQVVFVYGWDDTLYRSGDGGRSWQAVLTGRSATTAPQLVYAPGLETEREIFLLAGQQVYHSKDGGLTWQEPRPPLKVVPTALAISPNFAQDKLLFVGTENGHVSWFVW
jgi:photosystem II stability/assembly factor-like uncharacterized protein